MECRDIVKKFNKFQPQIFLNENQRYYLQVCTENVSSVLTIASKKAILLSTLFDHFYLLNMRHQELVSEFIKTCTRQYVPASLRQHLATQYPEFVRNLCRLRRVVLLVARKKTDVDQSPQFFRNLSCVITLNQRFSLRILYCVVDTGYGLDESLGNCKPALLKGRKYQMVKTQTKSHTVV